MIYIKAGKIQQIYNIESEDLNEHMNNITVSIISPFDTEQE